MNVLGGTSEEYCRLYSNRGLVKSCDHHDPKPESSQFRQERIDFTKVKRGESVYVCTTAMPFFLQNQFPQIPEPFVLVTGDGDEVAPFDCFPGIQALMAFLANPKVLHWFATNCVLEHPKITRIPYGLDYHTCTRPTSWGPILTPLAQEELLMRIRGDARPFWERKPLAYWNIFAIEGRRFGEDRANALAKIPPESLWREEEIVPREETWRRQTEFAFVVSPHSNGLDCIRTWEALNFGCIPIVRRSHLDGVYDGLPVLIVDEWEHVTPPLLIRTLAEFRGRTWEYERLTLDYWVERIRAAASS
jgi:hypothetical protein